MGPRVKPQHTTLCEALAKADDIRLRLRKQSSQADNIRRCIVCKEDIPRRGRRRLGKEEEVRRRFSGEGWRRLDEARRVGGGCSATRDDADEEGQRITKRKAKNSTHLGRSLNNMADKSRRIHRETGPYPSGGEGCIEARARSDRGGGEVGRGWRQEARHGWAAAKGREAAAEEEVWDGALRSLACMLPDGVESQSSTV
uniref:Uncharacterized protein n=1 Tax=Oryza punctata TaxID=4537 RepID=A0A0E0JF91_ORYPU